MVTKKKSKFEEKYKSSSPIDSRIANIRTERCIKDDLPKLSLNFKDFDFNQCPPGQTLEEWQTEGKLSVLVNKFIDVCSYNRVEAEQLQLLKIYGEFPSNSEFKVPSHIEGDVVWGTIQRVGGQKPRLAGYIIGSTFYPVFLDKNHRFFPSGKKHT